jgi:hypothetical protein
MRVFFILTLAVLSTRSLSKQVPNTLRCLGLEEKRYHELKSTSPLYHLNQSLISFFGEHPSSIFIDKSFKNSCPDIPSYYFIKSMLTNPNKYFNTLDSSGEFRDLKFENQLKFILLEKVLFFLTKTQENSSKINCLETKSPSYKKVKFQLYYLQENIDQFDQLISTNLLSSLYNDLTKISVAGDCSIPQGL